MTTPYGTTTFRTEDPLSATYLYLEAIDPLGGTERVEYWTEHPSLPATAPASEVPTGFTAANYDLNRFVTLYWDKRAMALQPRALASATITKLLLRGGPDYFGGTPNTSIPSSIKRPLEGRIWYQYPNQSSVGSMLVGMGMQPSVTARVLDDGSSQIWQATYNSLGHVTSRTDPLGRRTSYVYAANNIDLLEVRQTTGSMNDLLATYSNYNVTHLPQTITDAAGQTTTFTYNAAGQVLTVTNAKSETTTYAYDTAGHGYLQSVTGPVAGATTTYTYDTFGRVRTTTDADGYTLTMDYDPLDRLTKTTYPDGTYEQRTYYRLDVAESRDRLGRITRYLVRRAAAAGEHAGSVGTHDHAAVVRVRQPRRAHRREGPEDELAAGHPGPGDARSACRWCDRNGVYVRSDDEPAEDDHRSEAAGDDLQLQPGRHATVDDVHQRCGRHAVRQLHVRSGIQPCGSAWSTAPGRRAMPIILWACSGRVSWRASMVR